MRRMTFDVAIVGAGPAGMAAAVRAAEQGARVGVIDTGPGAGGQIWRGGAARAEGNQAQSWLTRYAAANTITHLTQTQLVAPLQPGELLAETTEEALRIEFGKLVLATGARERFLPFPGWTLPGVIGVGGLQSLVKGGLPIASKRVVVAGSGPLLLAVAAYLASKGAQVHCIAEQAPWTKLVPFVARLGLAPAKAAQALAFARRMGGISLRAGCWPIEAHGGERLEAVTLRQGRRTWRVACDYLACGFGLIPNIEPAQAFGCATRGSVVRVDEWQATTVEGVYAAGEIAGVGGVDLALVEGQIAGLAATGQRDTARQLFAERDRTRRFAAELEFTFALQPELARLAHDETIICRCEDVPYGALRKHTSWRAAKLHTRCGMGACQGRVCGDATTFLLGWGQDSVRPPLAATRVGTLAAREE